MFNALCKLISSARESCKYCATKNLAQIHNGPIGYSDHTLGFSSAILSVGMGAIIIEKHFTKDNNFSDFRDHKLALNPENFQVLLNH